MEPEDEVILDIFNARKTFKAIKASLNEKVAEALRREKQLPSVISDECLSDEDEPLSTRISKVDKKKILSEGPRTRSSRQHAKKKKEESQTDVVILTDSDDDVICNEPVIESLCDTSLDLNATRALDLTFDDEGEDEDEEDEIVAVKINWMNLKVLRFELKKHEAFTTVFQQLVEKENVPREKILLILRDKVFVTEEDTPGSLNLSIIDLIEGGITKEIFSSASEGTNMLELKCVLKDKKKPLLVTIRKTDPMNCLMLKISEQLEYPLEKLKFLFEGEELESDTTPVDLDLEGGEVIDVILKKL